MSTAPRFTLPNRPDSPRPTSHSLEMLIRQHRKRRKPVLEQLYAAAAEVVSFAQRCVAPTVSLPPVPLFTEPPSTERGDAALPLPEPPSTERGDAALVRHLVEQNSFKPE